MEFHKNLVKTNARGPGSHSLSQNSVWLSVTLMLNKPHSPCMYVCTNSYIITLDVYTMHIYMTVCS